MSGKCRLLGVGISSWKWNRPGLSALAVTGLAFFTLVAQAADTDSYYTKAQAERGHQVYSSYCSECHAANLGGQSGPALAGQQFKESLEYSKMSAEQLFSFISSQMPYNQPGSLKQEQYINVLAYILKQNGYPEGKRPLTTTSLGRVKLLPYPGKGHSKSSEHSAND
jgi:mono/diheme cytochrome c family protein